MIVSEIYAIEDCIYYNDTELTYTSTGTKVFNGILTNFLDVANTNFELEFDLKCSNTSSNGGLNVGATSQYTPPSSANYRLFLGTGSNQFSFNNRTNTSSESKSGTVTANTYYTMKLTKNGTTVVGYYNNTQIASKTANWLSNYNSYDLYYISWGGTTYVKNIKIKVL